MTDREDYIKELHEEKCLAHSRENEDEQCEVCDDCEMNYPECNCDPQDCQQAADEERAENDWEARRESRE